MGVWGGVVAGSGLWVLAQESEAQESTWELQSKAGAGLSHRRMGCRCKGFVWISPCMTNLRFCVYW